MNMVSKSRRLRWRAELQLTTALLLSMIVLLFPGIGAEAVFAQTPPSAVGKSATTTEDTPITIDTGITVDPLYEVKQTNAGPNSPAHGSVVAVPGGINGKYAINYTPGPNRVDAVSFQYHLCMTIPPNSCGSAATVNVTITPANDAPTADNDTATTPEDTAIAIDVLNGDSAGPADENQSLTIVDLQNPTSQGGTAIVAAGKVTYTPAADFCGTDTFTYRAQDNGGLKSSAAPAATVTVTVTCVNDKPKANADTPTVNEDSANNAIDVLSNDIRGPANESSQILSILDIPTAPTHGTAVVNGGMIDYTPAPNFCGTDSFEYQIVDDVTIDGTAKKDKGVVTVTVTCIIDKPTLSIKNVSPVVDHMFTADIVLTSPDKDISGVNLDLDYSCLLMPDVDPSSTPPAPPFFFDVQDDGSILKILVGSTTSPAAVLAGPSASAELTIATVKFTVDSSCVTNNQASVGLDIVNDKFSGPNAAPVAGDPPADYPAGTLPVTNANQTPTDITLAPSSVPENITGAFVGFLSTTDPDAGDTHTYKLVNARNPECPTPVEPTSNARDLDIPTGANYVRLRDTKTANFTVKPFYDICVESADSYGAKFYEKIRVDVVQGNQPPIAVNDGMLDIPNGVTINPGPIVVKGATDIDVLVNDVDPNGNNTIVVDAITNGARGMVINNGTNVTFVATDAVYRGNDTFSYTIKDNGGLTDNADVTVKIQQDKAPGNCNGQGGLDAGDLTAWGLEFFDGDDNTKWYLTPNRIGGGTFDGSPYGCNANQNTEIDAGDLTCIGILYFNGVCNPAVLAASSQTTASLAVSSDLVAAPGASVSVPINLSGAGNAVAAAAFAVDFDDTVLSFDATDANADGIPDAVTLNIPSGLFTMVNYNATESRIEIIVSGMAPPFPLLSDGVLATITLTAGAGTNGTQSAIQLTNSSLGNDEGMPVPVDVTDGMLQVNVDGTSQLNYLYLPTIQR